MSALLAPTTPITASHLGQLLAEGLQHSQEEHRDGAQEDDQHSNLQGQWDGSL